MKAPRIIQVGQEKYKVQHYPTTRGLNLLTEIFLILGEPLVMTIVGIKDALDAEKNFKDINLTPEMIQPIMSGLLARLSPEKVDDLFKKILDQTFLESNGRSVLEDYETRFAGEYKHLFTLVIQTLGVQYGDFLGVLGGLAKGSGLANLKPLS